MFGLGRRRLTDGERQALIRLITESGPALQRDIERLLQWAGHRPNDAALRMLLTGEFMVSMHRGSTSPWDDSLIFRARDGKPPAWLTGDAEV